MAAAIDGYLGHTAMHTPSPYLQMGIHSETGRCLRPEASSAPGIRLCLAIQSQEVEATQLQEVLNHVQCPRHLAEQQHPVPCTAKQM